MSSFKKTVKSSLPGERTLSEPVSKISGVKSWINNGLGLVSVGNKQLDELFGGGLALGTVLLIETESYSNHGETLYIYSLSESISMQHDTVLVCGSDEANRIISTLPYNQTIGGVAPNNADAKREERLQEQKKELSIAWQYGKYLGNEGSIPAQRCIVFSNYQFCRPGSKKVSVGLTSGSYCCSYDLSKRYVSAGCS